MCVGLASDGLATIGARHAIAHDGRCMRLTPRPPGMKIEREPYAAGWMFRVRPATLEHERVRLPDAGAATVVGAAVEPGCRVVVF
jgi:hypothetical protein